MTIQEMQIHKSASKFIALAISVGRYYQSDETKFVHYVESFKKSAPYQSIPIYENFLWIYGLFRSHQKDRVIEAKKLLARLIQFQTPSGAFSTYLHEYPFVYQKEKNCDLLLPLALLYKNYACIIESPLKEQLYETILSLLEYVKMLEQTPLMVFQVQVICHLLFGDKEPEIPLELNTSYDYSQYVLYAQFFKERVSLPWSYLLNRYIGAPKNQKYNKTRPALTILDLFLCEKEMGFWKKQEEDFCIQCLSAALIHFMPEVSFMEPQDETYQFSHLKNHFIAYQKQTTLSKEYQNNLPLFQIVGKDIDLVAEINAFSKCSYQKGLFSAEMTLSDEYDEKSSMPIQLFLLRNDAVSILCEDGEKTATTFQLDETLWIKTEEQTFKVTFKKLRGEGILSGHIFFGNRTSQNSYEACVEHVCFDHLIGLRVIEYNSSNPIQIRIEISYTNDKK